MQLKRFFAQDSRTAMRQVREMLGLEAIIISNRRVSGGVEVFAATDYDSQAITLQAKQQHSEPQIASQQRTGTDVDVRVSLSNDRPAPSAESIQKAPSPASISSIAKAAEPDMETMREELRSIRSMLEHQLSGLAWREYAQESPLSATLSQKLLQYGLSSIVCRKLLAGIADDAQVDAAWQESVEKLIHLIPIAQNDPLQTGGILALIGPTGVGKTTTLIKLATRYILEHGRENLLIISTDNIRIAAREQLQTFAQILGISVLHAATPKELRQLLQQSKQRLILIDTPGISQSDPALLDHFDQLSAEVNSIRNYLVLSATNQYGVLKDTTRQYGKLPLAGCIITKLDECDSLGEVISAGIEAELPIAYATDGQQIPDDMQIATAEGIINRLLATYQHKKHELGAAALAARLPDLMGAVDS